jgi:hypothetical protein
MDVISRMPQTTSAQPLLAIPDCPILGRRIHLVYHSATWAKRCQLEIASVESPNVLLSPSVPGIPELASWIFLHERWRFGYRKNLEKLAHVDCGVSG